GRPVYEVLEGRPVVMTWADSGQRLESVPQEMAMRVARAWTGGAASGLGLMASDDPWTAYDTVHPYGPFWKFAGRRGDEIYVSATTGEVVQHSTRTSRMAAWLGAIPHWMYYPWLLKSRRVWGNTVVWLSGAACVAAVLGVVAGVWLYSP